MTAPSDGDFPKLSAALPSIARMYDYCLGGRHNYEVDRAAVQAFSRQFPWGVHDARVARQFLYRLVRFLARDAGITQFLNLGSGLPSGNNVHQVAQQFQPGARVVYVDNDPTVLAYGRALLATDDRTIVIGADLTRPKEILEHPETNRLLDLTRSVAVLVLGVGHLIVDDGLLEGSLGAMRDAIAPGGYLAFAQMCMPTQQAIDEHHQAVAAMGLAWRTRLPQQVAEMLHGLEPVEPGLVYVGGWRPDPSQPDLLPVDEPLHPYLAVRPTAEQGGNYGGVLRKP